MKICCCAAEEEYSREHTEDPISPKSPTTKLGTSPGNKSNVWQNTFNPGWDCSLFIVWKRPRRLQGLAFDRELSLAGRTTTPTTRAWGTSITIMSQTRLERPQVRRLYYSLAHVGRTQAPSWASVGLTCKQASPATCGVQCGTMS